MSHLVAVFDDHGFPGKWDDWLIALGAIVGACSVIYLKMIRPASRRMGDFMDDVGAIRRLMENEPVLTQVVAAFSSSDGKKSLPQRVEGLEEKVDAVEEKVDEINVKIDNMSQQWELILTDGMQRGGEHDKQT